MTRVALPDAELARLSFAFETESAEEVVRWAIKTFETRVCIAASMTDAVLIDIAVRIEPSVEVIFLDTQYHFPETLQTLEVVRAHYRLNLTIKRPDYAPDDLWRSDPDACCSLRKVQQLDDALRDKEAWMTGLRRAESASRADAPFLSRDSRGLVRVSPLIKWTDGDVARYIAAHDVPVNPLLARGFPSIGCWPCTRAVDAGEDRRAGRWPGHAKTECGIHDVPSELVHAQSIPVSSPRP